VAWPEILKGDGKLVEVYPEPSGCHRIIAGNWPSLGSLGHPPTGYATVIHLFAHFYAACHPENVSNYGENSKNSNIFYYKQLHY
jgi:hypothetical protein